MIRHRSPGQARSKRGARWRRSLTVQTFDFRSPRGASRCSRSNGAHQPGRSDATHAADPRTTRAPPISHERDEQSRRRRSPSRTESRARNLDARAVSGGLSAAAAPRAGIWIPRKLSRARSPSAPTISNDRIRPSGGRTRRRRPAECDRRAAGRPRRRWTWSGSPAIRHTASGRWRGGQSCRRQWVHTFPCGRGTSTELGTSWSSPGPGAGRTPRDKRHEPAGDDVESPVVTIVGSTAR